ncbi:MAG: hypothetical protein ACFFAS_05920 [Promethearchaeota archaeon]
MVSHKKLCVYFTLGLIALISLSCVPSAACQTVGCTGGLSYGSMSAAGIYPVTYVQWSFSGTNPNVSISLRLYNETSFLNDGPYIQLSSGKTADSGIWYAPENWTNYGDESMIVEVPKIYFVFENLDPVRQYTNLSFLLEFDAAHEYYSYDGDTIPGYIGIFLIVPIIIAVSSLIFVKKTKKS